MKSNDDIPEDEMILAEMLAAANAKGLKWTRCAPFRDANGWSLNSFWEKGVKAESCCAIGALSLSREAARGYANELFAEFQGLNLNVWLMINGNDNMEEEWSSHDNTDRGYSLGHAFKIAMGD